MIALVGGEGSIGRRYQAVLNYLREPYLVIEKNDDPALFDAPEITHAIIATTTENHMEWCERAAKKNIWFLCEKPMSKKKEEIQKLFGEKTMGFVVNNWAFVECSMYGMKPKRISYNFYNTGKDGLVWDVCQLVYLSHLAQGTLEARTESHEWTAYWNDFLVPYNSIEASYVQMVRTFLAHDSKRLWSLTDAYEMSWICEEGIKELGESCEGFYRDSSQKRWEPLTRKSFRTDRTKAPTQMVV